MEYKFLFIIFLIFFIPAIAWFFFWNKVSISNSANKGDSQYSLEKKIANINNIEIEIELADTPFKRGKGLSGRQSIPDNFGMFFVFEKPGFYSFWMINMKFPIDIIWIDKNLEIVGFEKNVLPKSFPKIFRPNMESQYVLEVNAGWVDKYNIKKGDNFSFEE